MTTPIADRDSSIAAQHRALQHGCGAYRSRRDVVTVEGRDALEYLQGQCSQDVAVLEIDGATDALLLAPEGRLVALVRILRTEEGFQLDTAPGWGSTVLERLRRFALRTKVEFRTSTRHCLSLRGPHTRRIVEEMFDAPIDSGLGHLGIHVLQFSWNGSEGIDLLIKEEGIVPALPDDVPQCDAEIWEAHRIESGIPAMGRELDTRTIPAEAGLVERTVDFAKGCYTGQELVARLDARGSRVPKRLVGVVVDPVHSTSPTHLLGATLLLAEQDRVVGTCTSVAYSPGFAGLVALAYLHRSVEVPARVLLRAKDAPEASEAIEAPGVAQVSEADGSTWGGEVQALPMRVERPRGTEDTKTPN